MEPNKEDFIAHLQIYKRIIYKICHAYCKSKDDIEDLAQEIIYQLWKSFGNYNNSFKFSTWMYRIALNTAISFYRSRKKHSHHVIESIHLIQMEVAADDNSITEANITLLQHFIHQLKELDRALMLLYLEENSYKEIAEILGISESNVATKISRIKEKLKQDFLNQKQ